MTAQFAYKAKTSQGLLKSGTIQADNQNAVIRKLRQDGLYPITIEQTGLHPVNKRTRKKVKPAEITAFTGQLANLIQSGFPFSVALSTLSSQCHNPALKKITDELQEAIQKGSAFSDALTAYPACFSGFYINLVKIGETGGKLNESLERLAEAREHEQALTSQVKSALAYPLFVLAIGMVTIFILVAFFIPRMAGMFYGLKQKLPFFTELILTSSRLVNKFGLIFIASTALIALRVKSYYKSERNRAKIDRIVLTIPVIKDIIIKMETARFAYALAILLKNAVPMIGALEVVSLTMVNRFLKEKITLCRKKIDKGESLSSCLRSEKVFPTVLTNMTAIGETGGRLSEMLFKAAESFEAEIHQNLKTAVSLLEPVLILFIGGITLCIVFAALLPIFQINFLETGP